MSQPDGQVDLAAALSARLREAHRRVAQLAVGDDEKARATRRLLAISDGAKHDMRRASGRLDVLLNDWDEGRIGAGDEPSGPSSSDDQT